MKKLLVLLLVFGLLCCGTIAQAGSPVEKEVIDVILDDDPTEITGYWNTGNFERVAFFVVYDETQVGNAISIAITVDVSRDGTTWLDASYYDVAGGATLQTTETLNADSSYYGWFDNTMQIPFVRVSIVATNTDVDDLADVTAYIVGLQ
jgi:hypothetical protein